jgi:epoxyqueuosine reductase
VETDLPEDINEIIIKKAKELGSSLAGFAEPASLENSPSFTLRSEVKLGQNVNAVLVLALVHDESQPELDWWVGKPYRSTGHRILLEISDELVKWLKSEYDIEAKIIPYSIRKGGIFLKDAAVIAGLGIIGKNNLLITSEYGPRVRLSALGLDTSLSSTGPIDFDPCEGCDMPCKKSCPQNAFGRGNHSKTQCKKQMANDELSVNEIKYCRKCEFSCPVGRPKF